MFLEIVYKHAEATPNKVAVKDNVLSVTYSELRAYVEGYAAKLRHQRIKSTDCVALYLPNSVEFIVALLALYRLGATSVLLDFRAQPSEINRMLSDSSASAIIVSRDYILGEAKWSQTVRVLPVDIDAITAARQSPPEDTPIEHLDSTSIVQYTSGVSGMAKGVQRTWRHNVADGQNFAETASYSDEDIILCTTPLHHGYALSTCLLPGLIVGATLILASLPVVPRHLVRLVLEERVTVLQAVPFIYNLLIRSYDGDQPLFTSLRLCLSAGELLKEDTAAGFSRLFSLPITNHYGTTETGAITLNLRHVTSSVGTPIHDVEVRVVDNSGKDVPVDCNGEIIVRSPALGQGYANRPDLTAERFRDGWFYTGDIGSKDIAGNIYIHSRVSQFINVAGNKVDPVEIESVLAQHPKVKEIAVVGIPSPLTGELVKAFIVPSGPISEVEIRQFLAEKLAAYKIPSSFAFIERLPRSSTKKILRKYLIDQAEEGRNPLDRE